jgi:hypothetical protein
VGDAVDLQVVVHAPQAVRGVQFGLRWDPALIHANVPLTDGQQFPAWAAANNAALIASPAWRLDNAGGTVSSGGLTLLGAAPTAGPKDFTVARVPVTAIATGTVTIQLTGAELVTVTPSDGVARKSATVPLSLSLTIVPPSTALVSDSGGA